MYARRSPVSSPLETTSPARRQFSPSGFSVRCPTAAVAMNSSSASRLSSSHWGILSRMPSTTQTADVLHVPRELEVMAMEWESLNAKAELARMHRDGQCHVGMKWHVHHLLKPMKTLTLCESKAVPRRATTQGPFRERGLTQISWAGNPERQLSNCQAGPTASSTPLLLNAQMPWGGHP